MTRNFKRSEFACRCGCGFNTVDYALMDGLQRLRDIVGEPIIINSGCRCRSHNAAIGGAAKSQHMLGRAADIRIHGYKPADVAGMAGNLPEFTGIGIYDTFVHVDTRNGHWRGDNRSK